MKNGTKLEVRIEGNKPQVFEVPTDEEKVGPCYLCLLELGCDFDSPWHKADSDAAVALIEKKAFGLTGALRAALLGSGFETATELHKALKKMKGAVEFLEGKTVR